MSSSSAAASSSPSSAAVADVPLATLLHAPLSFVQAALNAQVAATLGATAAVSPLAPAAIKSLHKELAASNWGVEAAMEQALGLKEKRASPNCKIAMVSRNENTSSRPQDSRKRHQREPDHCLPLCLVAFLCSLQIPSLNSLNAARDVSHLRPNQLVRFRGMIQETFQPDFYSGLFQEQASEEQKEPQAFETVRTTRLVKPE